MITEADNKKIREHGLETEEVRKQIERFEQGFASLDIQSAATAGKGIKKLSDSEKERYINLYDKKLSDLQIVKFVPASGAASRMFKILFEFMEKGEEDNSQGKNLIEENEYKAVKYFFDNIRKFAFYNELNNKTEENTGENIQQKLEKKEYVSILKTFLTSKGMAYGNKPKGLLKFHSYENKVRTPFEEHLVEGAAYGKDTDNKVQLHFTVSQEHQKWFEKLFEDVRTQYEQQFKVKFEVTFSQQKPETDTIAVDMNNSPFRDKEGNILFRPGGHGALIENLNDINADVIFVKNIDNVVPDKLKYETVTYKKAIAGVLIETVEKAQQYLLKETKDFKQQLGEVENFLKENMNVLLPAEYENYTEEEKINYLRTKLNRPFRVCGMVKNEGEPGGGPFWAKNNDKSVSLQIVESSQIDMNDTSKINIVNSATHFNPVDLVVWVKDYKGNKFDLMNFIDEETGFISEKSKDGAKLKALERPGLWNGAMSDWNTIFVEVPILTFNPVKIVNDLLRDQHQ